MAYNMEDSGTDSEISDLSEYMEEASINEDSDIPRVTNMGVRPYMFEPLAPPEIPQNSTHMEDSADELAQEVRVGNTNWCSCGNCVEMLTETESVCCREIPMVWKQVEELSRFIKEDNPDADVSHLQCIIQHEGFEPGCLNPWPLRIAYLHFRQQYGDHNGTQHEKYRYTAYRQLVRWCWGYLGKKHRVVLPSCAVNKIRQTYPAEEGSYKGFRWPTL